MAVAKSIICPVLVGRAPQLQRLTDLIGNVCTRKPFLQTHTPSIAPLQIVLISGEAGIGKSRLVSEVTSIALQRGMFILQGRCFEQDHAFPYAPLIDLIGAFCAANSPARIEQALKQPVPALIKIFPELSLHFPSAASSPTLEPEHEKRRLFQALMQFIRHVGEPPVATKEDLAPLLLIFEDLHWCDDVSLDFLLYLARHANGRPMLLVGTYRSDEVTDSLQVLLAELDRLRAVTELRLPRLSLGDTDNMLRSILSPSRPLRYDLLESLFRLTEGNPFFIEEGLKTMLESGDIFERAGEWEYSLANELRIPRTVQVAVRRRLDTLSPATRRLIQLAAVAGPRFRLGLLQQLLSQPDADLFQQLRELLRAQIVVEESVDTYAFRHALTRETIYQSLLGHERQVLHRTIANTIERIHTNNIDIHLTDLAYHFYESGEWTKAFSYAQQAGERAQALDATRAALLQFTRALEAAAHLGIMTPLPLWRARGQAHQALGNLAAARADYESILEIAHTTHNREAEWQSSLDLGFAWTSNDYKRAGDYFKHALNIARELGIPVLLAQTLNRIGNWDFMSGRPLEGRMLHEEALGIVRSIGDPRELASTLDLLGISSYGVGDLLAGGKYYEQAITLYRQMGDRRGLIACLCAHPARGGCYITMTAVCVPTDLADIIREGEEAIQIAKQMGWHPNEAYALSFHAFALGPHGEFARALEAAQRSLTIATEIEHDFFIITANVGLGALYYDLLDFEKAQQHFQEAQALAQNAGATFVVSNVSAYLAKTYLALNRIRQAEGLLQSFLPDVLSLSSEALRWLWTAKAEFLLKLGQGKQALRLIEEVIQAVPSTHEGGIVPRLWLLRAQVLQTLERYHEARHTLREALEVAQNSTLLPVVWRIQIALGNILQAERRLPEARVYWSAARATIEQLASKVPPGGPRELFMQHAFALVPDVATFGRQATRKELGGLTMRERDVALLVTQGKSNLEIAEELVLSRRTVEVHVANIMTRLGVRTRAQIAVWVVENGLGKAED